MKWRTGRKAALVKRVLATALGVSLLVGLLRPEVHDAAQALLAVLPLG